MATKTRQPVTDTPEALPTVEPLTMSSRCDATQTGTEQAFTRFRKAEQSLELCAHHANKYEADLIGKGWNLEIDDRHRVNSAPSPSANSIAPVLEAD